LGQVLINMPRSGRTPPSQLTFLTFPTLSNIQYLNM
jgi:hypothetical protein